MSVAIASAITPPSSATPNRLCAWADGSKAMRVSSPAASPRKLGMPAAPLLRIQRECRPGAPATAWNTGRQV
jgi:hypothetical protein